MPSLFVICRLCMKKYSSAALMENIFCGEAATVDAIRLVTQIQVAEGDGLPEHVCLFCVFALNSAKNFIQSCIQSNKKLILQAKVSGSKFLKTDIVKKSSSPVVTPASGFPRHLKVELSTPNVTECVVRRLELEIDAQDNADEDSLKNDPKDENDVLDEIDASDISSLELDTGNDAENAVQLPLSQASGSSALNAGNLPGPQESTPKEDDCKQQPLPSSSKCNPGLIPSNEPKLNESAMVLSWYDSDLNLVIDKEDFLSAAPVHINAFGYMWAGARATFGFSDGKLAFQTKVEENLDVSHLEEESYPNVLRVGWSVPSASMQLGEVPRSYGFCGTGRAFTGCKFKDYGVPFKVGDIVTSSLEWSKEDALLSFAVNGKTQGKAFRVPRKKLNGQPLFPHILSKNQRFSVDFGAREKPWFPLDEGFVFVGAVPVESRVPGLRRPENKGDCEMVMMCGLPGAGKTTWVNRYVSGVPEKRFNVLGTSALIDKMKVNGLSRRSNYKGSWEQLIEKCTHCLLKLIEVAAGRRRNYILDQTNVYPSAQKRKMEGFEGFNRSAIVIVPTDEEFKSRVAKRKALEEKDIPDTAVLEMKANFALPEEGDMFSSVTFVELEREKAQVLVEQYKKEAQAAGYCKQNKRPRLDSSNLDGSFGLQGREYRIKCGRNNASQRSRGSGGQPRGRSQGTWRGRNNYHGTRGGSSYNRQGLQASSAVSLQNSTGYNQGGGGCWNNDQVWTQNYYLQQHGSGSQEAWNYTNIQLQQWAGYSRQLAWNKYNQYAWSNFSQQALGSSLLGVYGQHGGYGQQSSYAQQTGYANYNWNGLQ